MHTYKNKTHHIANGLYDKCRNLTLAWDIIERHQLYSLNKPLFIVYPVQPVKANVHMYTTAYTTI